MDFPKSDIVGLIYQLMPGFVAAWCFFGLTAHQKTSPFERTIQALIFTGIVKAIVVCLHYVLTGIGARFVSVGEWTPEWDFVVSIILGAVIGVLFSSGANNNWPHGFLPEWVSKRTSFPSEWYGTFSRDKRYVVLHLKGQTENRRLLGWPFEWPDSPTTGHFVLIHARWLLSDNTEIRIRPAEKILISATEVEMIEVLEEAYLPDESQSLLTHDTPLDSPHNVLRKTNGIETADSTSELEGSSRTQWTANQSGGEGASAVKYCPACTSTEEITGRDVVLRVIVEVKGCE